MFLQESFSMWDKKLILTERERKNCSVILTNVLQKSKRTGKYIKRTSKRFSDSEWANNGLTSKKLHLNQNKLIWNVYVSQICLPHINFLITGWLSCCLKKVSPSVYPFNCRECSCGCLLFLNTVMMIFCDYKKMTIQIHWQEIHFEFCSAVVLSKVKLFHWKIV